MLSALQKLRLKYSPKIPNSLKQLASLEISPQDAIPLSAEVAEQFQNLKQTRIHLFKPGHSKKPDNDLKIGILFSGGPASGGHNVATGVFDALHLLGKGTLVGFLNGPSGLIDNQFCYLESKEIDAVRNQGGFDLLGSGRTKIETEEQFAKSMAACQKHQLDGLIIVGGDDSNTNAALLAEYFAQRKVKTSVIGVPKTIDGDLKNRWIDISFGFDSASKTYSEIIGNVLQDAASQGKYYFFVKVMGRTASNLVLECALKTHPHLTLISEEGKSLKTIVQEIVNLIVYRAGENKQHGVILIPEGLIEFIPEIKLLIAELGKDNLSAPSAKVLESLPKDMQQLLKERDPHGNIPVSQIETEKLLITLVKEELQKRADYKGKFTAQPLFCGYEGRSCLPSNFDANYCYSLGLAATVLVKYGLSGYMAVIQRLNQPVESWIPAAIPLTAMIAFEERSGKKKPVIQKGLVDLQGKAFHYFSTHCNAWRLKDDFLVPGPIQFFGPPEITDTCPLTINP